MYKIVRREAFSDTTFLWEVHAPDVARAAQPGHFVMLRLHDGSERIPLTVADMDRKAGTITMVIQALGKTTKEMMNDYREGDLFDDFVGPLGLPQHTDKVGHVVLVGGGLGVAPVYPQLRAFKQAGNRTTGIIGFRSKPLVFWEQKFRDYCDALVVCTDDGSYGTPGFVTAALKKICETDKPDLVIAIGPLPMMNACVETTRPFGVKTMVSLNAIMVDGTGMCGSCRVTVDKEVKFACVDGPDFDGHKVDFVELGSRQRRFKQQEAVATADYAHVCNLEKQLFEEQKRNYKKIKELAPHQTKMPERDARERAQNFKEVNLGYGLSQALEEAERCIQCSKPTCIAGCPVAIDIPRFIRHLLVRDIDGAAAVINEASIFPSVCGRVCPQESQCEAQCIIAKKVDSVGIGRLERFVGDNAQPRKVDPPRFAAGDRLGKVAICGSGPAGLAAAADLVKYGCDVTVYEALHVVGGVLRYGIPSFRLPRDIIDREVKKLTDMGVKIETNKVIGKTFTVPQLQTEMGYDAVFLGVGAGAPAFLGIPGEFAGQVYSANEFLTRVNLMGGDKFPYLDTPISLGKNVVVIGAGNTAMDCLRVAKRLGVPNVRCVYRRTEAEAPARIEELRHAKEEGIEFFFLHSPAEIRTDKDGNVTGMKAEKMALGAPDEKGRKKPVATGEYIELACDTVIYALGTKPNPIITKGTPGLGLNQWGNIAADDGDGGTQATTLPGVFAGGDIVTGGATVILAMGAGRRAARSIGAWLRSDRKRWPLTREDVEKFVPPKALLSEEGRHGPGWEEGRHGPGWEEGRHGPGSAVTAHAGATATGPQAPAKLPPQVFAFVPESGAPSIGSVMAPVATPGIAPAEPPGVSGRRCPKCHRPLEDAEASGDYVCCAEATLTWRCGDCAKVSEGFAFPYGLCPHCGGRLNLAGPRRPAPASALVAVRIAFEIELGGMAFYSRAAVDATDPELAALFEKFARMEREHMATLSRRYHVDVAAPGAFNLDRAAIYAGIPHDPDDPANLFRIAIAFEQRAVKFFSEQVDQCPAGSVERELYQELAAEEREHVDILATEYTRWKAGKPGLL